MGYSPKVGLGRVLEHGRLSTRFSRCLLGVPTKKRTESLKDQTDRLAMPGSESGAIPYTCRFYSPPGGFLGLSNSKYTCRAGLGSRPDLFRHSPRPRPPSCPRRTGCPQIMVQHVPVHRVVEKQADTGGACEGF